MEYHNENVEDYRYERKFFINHLSLHELDLLVKLHPAMFREIYHRRFVNNIYLDSSDIRNYFDNVNGSKSRVKARIRWYGELLGDIEKPNLELKIKEGLLGRKETVSLPSFKVDNNIQLDYIQDLLKNTEMPDKLKFYILSLEFALLNRYMRKYYISANNHYRITVDSDMEFYKIGPRNNNFLNKLIDTTNLVLELKYDRENDRLVNWITSKFPFLMTRSSKYVMGIEKLNLW